MLHRIDVGRVDERDARTCASLDPVEPIGGHGCQRSSRAQRCLIGRAGQHDGIHGRRSEHAGAAHRTAGQRVHERGLARTGRPEQQDDQRRVQVASTRQEVRAGVFEELTSALRRAVGRSVGRCLAARRTVAG